MKKIFGTKHLPINIDISLLLGRIGIGAFMLTHGIPKIARFAESPVKFMDFMGLGPEISLGLAIFAEVVCSILVMLGFATRLAVIPLIVTMLVAVFIAHGDDPFAKQEMGLHYLLVYVMLLLSGSGRYSVDRLISPK